MKLLNYSKKIIKEVFPEKSQKYTAYKSLLQDKNSFLYKVGWMNSLKTLTPVDQDGNYIPWMNYPVIDLLSERLNKEMCVFEYGSGYSTFFYGRLTKKVTSIEYDIDWYQKLKSSSLPSNAELIYQEKDIDGDYSRCSYSKIENGGYDLIVVDGRDRVNCIKHSIQSLNETGVILLDDSHRGKYQPGIQVLKKNNFKVLTFRGLKPTENGIHTTSIFYRSTNCLNI